jgi:hypothetical protein
MQSKKKTHARAQDFWLNKRDEMELTMLDTWILLISFHRLQDLLQEGWIC